MLTTWLYALLSVLTVSAISIFGALALLFLKPDLLKKLLIFLVSFSAGALLGGAFFHLLPEILEENGLNQRTGVLLFLGILIFFVLEKFVRWRHCHRLDCEEHSHHLATMNLVGDGLHNFLDGLIIAASYLTSLPLGLATTLAIIFHEIPQEIGDFGVLLHSGLNKGRAILYNLLSAFLAVMGTVIGLIFGQASTGFSANVLPIAAAAFIYIATADLMPELHKEAALKKSLWQIVIFVFGAALMYVFAIME